jgi:molybdopterin-binding protein
MLHPGAPSAIKQKKLTSSVSGRNQLVGKVVQVRFDGLLAQVKIAIADQIVTAVITADAARELQLRPGIKAAALIKATEVMVVRV